MTGPTPPTVDEGMREAVAHVVLRSHCIGEPSALLRAGAYQAADNLLKPDGPIASALAARERERDEARAAAMSWKGVAERLSAYIGRSDADLATLREALTPFAAILANGEPVGPIPRGLLDSKITRQDLRRATAALAPKEPHHG